MRLRLQITLIDNILTLFFLLLVLFFVMILALFWFFRMNITATGEGKVICAQWVDIKPEVSGILKNMYVKEGQAVKQGDLLLSLENRERKLEIESSLHTINGIRNKIANFEKSLSIKEVEVSGTILEVQSALKEAKAEYRIMKKGPKIEEISFVRRTVQRAVLQIEKANLDYDRMEKAFSLKLVSQQELDNISHQKLLAKTDLELEKDKLALLLNKYDNDQLDTAQARIERQQAIFLKAVSRKKEVIILEQNLMTEQKALITEEKKLAVLKKKLDLTNIFSPFNGIVMTYDPEHMVGRAVVKGEVVLKIGDTKDYFIECKISEKDFPLIKIGQEARITMKPFPRGEYKLFSAKVFTVGLESKEGMGTGLGLSDTLNGLKGNYYPVTLKLEKPYFMVLFGNRYEVKPGFSAEAEIIIEDERIATLLFKRVLRIKGKLTPTTIHL